MEQNIVIGPIKSSDWRLMRDLRESVKFMKGEDPIKYSKSIRLETEVYKETLQTYVQ